MQLRKTLFMLASLWILLGCDQADPPVDLDRDLIGGHHQIYRYSTRQQEREALPDFSPLLISRLGIIDRDRVVAEYHDYDSPTASGSEIGLLNLKTGDIDHKAFGTSPVFHRKSGKILFIDEAGKLSSINVEDSAVELVEAGQTLNAKIKKIWLLSDSELAVQTGHGDQNSLYRLDLITSEAQQINVPNRCILSFAIYLEETGQFLCKDNQDGAILDIVGFGNGHHRNHYA